MTGEGCDASVRVRSGRSFCFSPPWSTTDDAEVVFDRNSGDYWIVSAGVSSILRRLSSGERIDTGTLEPALQALIDDLVEKGLLQYS